MMAVKWHTMDLPCFSPVPLLFVFFAYSAKIRKHDWRLILPTNDALTGFPIDLKRAGQVHSGKNIARPGKK